jgi:two-component system nitrogen regulation response regulator NtrX
MADESILVVDDEPGVREALEGILGDEGFEVISVATGEEGLAVLASTRFDAVLLDVWLPGIDGIETLTRMRDRRVDTEVVMISGHGTIETAVRATKLGAFDFVEKPLSLEKTLLVLRNALRQRKLERSNKRLLEQLARDTEILGQSRAAIHLRRQVDAAAGADSPVLVRGERGTGRETLVRRIHSLSARAQEPFLKVHCGALDEAAAEQALFGTDAMPARIELASRGSLFLDGIGRLVPRLQARLSDFIDSPAFQELDVRLLASEDTSTAGLEDDLRQRLEVIRIDVPPLRDRREDIRPMLERFMKEVSHEYGRTEKQLSTESLRAMTAHKWPGNVRELRNLVERVVLTVPANRVDVRDLPTEIGGSEGPAVDLYGDFPTLKDALASFEAHYLSRTLAEREGDLDRSAEKLGIGRRKLEQRMAALGITTP